MAIHLTKLGIQGFQQFSETRFDFVDPKSGEPLKRVCFVGGNGVGKSTLLRLIDSLLSQEMIGHFPAPNEVTSEIQVNDDKVSFRSHNAEHRTGFQWRLGSADFSSGNLDSQDPIDAAQTCLLKGELESSLKIICPPDSDQPNSFLDENSFGPDSTLSDALEAIKEAELRVTVGQGYIASFWTELVAAIKKREQAFLKFQQRAENKDKTVRVVEAEFLEAHPEILKVLAEFWNPLLERAGLEFDYEGASEPVQLSDKLEAYVRLKKTGEKIPYHLLSTGIRNFIFKLGHIFTIFRRFPDKHGFLFVDEPENSLHPDFLYDLVDFYQRAAPNAQLFMATHNPIVAAQFRPEERFILSFDDDYNVKVTQGVSPEGDDPNDVLRKDFEVRSIYGKKGLEAWERFKELERSIKSGETKDSEQISEFMTLGSTYNFPVSQ